MKRPLHNKCRHVTAPVLVNNRFQVLATHADTSNAVLDDTHVDKPTHQQYRVCKQRLVDTKPSDVDICRPDPDCSVPPIGSQVSKNTSVSTRVKNDIGSSTVSSKSSHCSDILQSSQNGNISLSSQPNAARTIHLLDFKANVDVSESTYSNTAIPLPVWENRYQCVDFQRCTQQNGFEFGTVPLTPIKLYEGKQTGNQPVLDIIRLHYLVRQSNCPNFLGCRIPVQT